MTDTAAGRRVEDAIATATAITEIKGAIKNLETVIASSSTEVRSLVKLTEQRIEFLQREQRDHEKTVSDVDTKYAKELIELKKEILAALRQHTHDDEAPHQNTLGARTSSLESSRTYQRGMIALGVFIMPTITGIIFKLIGAN